MPKNGNSHGTVRERMGNSLDNIRAYFGGPLWLRIVAGAVGLYLFGALIIGWYWSREPELFSVRQNAEMTAAQANRQVVTGYTSVVTLKTIAETLLDKSGGYLSNDILPPGIWLDNMPNWEFGVLVQMRDFSRALRKDFSRSQSQSTEDADLVKAEPRFNFDNKSWALPASESEYQEGIKALGHYLARLSDPAQQNTRFYTRADNLNNWLGDVSTRLGSLSQRLSSSVGRSAGLPSSAGEQDADNGETNPKIRKTPWLQIDDVFYEARGQSWALLHLLRAVEVDFADVLAKKNAAVSLRQIIRELEETQDTLWSPMVLNGNGFGLLANHSLVMANYISRANAGIIDLRQLLSQG